MIALFGIAETGTTKMSINQRLIRYIIWFTQIREYCKDLKNRATRYTTLEIDISEMDV